VCVCACTMGSRYTFYRTWYEAEEKQIGIFDMIILRQWYSYAKRETEVV